MNTYKKFINKRYLITIWLIIISTWLIARTLNLKDIISKEAAITWIISPIFCLILSTIIQATVENTQSNEKLKLAIERLKRNRKYNCKNNNNKKVNWYSSIYYDKEYKLLISNRWKSDKKIIEEMRKDKYWDDKFSREALIYNTSKEEAQSYWIKDHFIY